MNHGRELLTVIVAVVVLFVWTIVALFAALISHEYTAVKFVTPVMLTLSAYLFGRGWELRRKNGKNGNGNGS